MTRDEAQSELAQLEQWWAQHQQMTQQAPAVRERTSYLNGLLADVDPDVDPASEDA